MNEDPTRRPEDPDGLRKQESDEIFLLFCIILALLILAGVGMLFAWLSLPVT